MTFTIQSPFRSAPRISLDGFLRILAESHSFDSAPLWDGAGDPRQAAIRIYNYIASHGHDPAVWLAVCAREHQYGTNKLSVLWRNDTHSWTNARTVRDPALMGSAVVITDPVRKSGYVKYQNVLDSVQDGIYRVDDPTYAYAGRTTLEEIFEKWTEDPAEYAAYVAGWLNRYATEGGDMAGDDSRFEWVPDQSEFGYGTGVQHGRSGKPIELLILHITQGTDSLDWLVTNHGSSAHYLTDRAGKPRAQMVAEADAAWTAGSREYNERGINVEVELPNVNAWTNAIIREVSRTIAPIMKRNGIPAVYLGRNAGIGKRGMIGHRDVPDGKGGWGGSTHHDDPGANFNWQALQSWVVADMAALDGGTPPPVDDPNAWQDPETGFWVVNDHGQPVLTWYRANGGWEKLGRPMEPMHLDADGVYRQLFENVLIESWPNGWGPHPGPWVRIGGLGQRYLAALERIAELEAA